MKKLCYVLICVLSLVLFYGCGGNASASANNTENTEVQAEEGEGEEVTNSDENADAKLNEEAVGEPIKDKAELKRMSTFLSNFTELGMFDFTTEDLLKNPDDTRLIHFGIWHNYGNSFKTKVSSCSDSDCPHGSLVIDAKNVTETIKKYFDVDFKSHKSVKPDFDFYAEYLYYYDGKRYHFNGADGEATFFARVKKASKDASSQITMTGELYNANDESEIIGTFKALAKPYKYDGKDTWAIISMANRFH